MSARLAVFWYKAAETLLLAMVFVLPLAFYLRTYDSVTIKITTFQLTTLALLVCWLMKGLERGRWEVPAAAWPLLTPALALMAWTTIRFAVAPYKLAALHGFLEQLLYLLVFCLVVVEFGGLGQARRFIGWLIGAAWVAGFYGVLQHLGVDPFIWKGAFGERAFSTFGNPALFGVFTAACVPLALTRLIDPELHDNWKRADLLLLGVLAAGCVFSGSSEGLMAMGIQCTVFAVTVSFLAPAKVAVRAVAVAGVVAILSLLGAGKPAEYQFARGAEVKRHTWVATWKMIQERPLDGWGPGSFHIHYPRFRPAAVIALEGKHNSATDHPESQFLSVAAELGGVGLALLAWLLGAVLVRGWRGARQLHREGALGESAYSAGLFSATLGTVVAAQAGIGSHFVAPGFLLWPLAGLLGGLSLLAREQGPVSVLPIPLNELQRKTLYAPSFAVFAVLAFFPVTWFDSDIEHNVSVAYYKTGDFERGFEHADRVRPGAPAYVMAQYFKGNALIDVGRPADAIAQYEKVAGLAPDYVQIHYQKGQAYAKMRDWESAIESYRQAARLDPLNVATFQRIAEAARAAGDLATARKAVFSAIALQPEEPQHWRELANIYVKEKRLAGSRKMQRHAVRLTGPDRKPVDIR